MARGSADPSLFQGAAPTSAEAVAAPPFLEAEVELLSLGYDSEEAGRHQGYSKDYVRDRRRVVRLFFNTESHNEVVSRAIQEGWLKVKTEKNPDLTPLSWMEERALILLASGWNSRQIAEHFRLGNDTITHINSQIRLKLGAKNLPHAIRRAYELGIFRVGEPVELSSELSSEAFVGLLSDSEVPVTVVDTPKELDLLRKVAMLGQSSFKTSELLALEGSLESGKTSHIGRAVLALMNKFSQDLGTAVVRKAKRREDGIKRWIYIVEEPIVIEVDGKARTIPKYVAPPQPKGGRPIGSRSSQPSKRVAKGSAPRAIELKAVCVEPLNLPPEQLDPKELPVLTKEYMEKKLVRKKKTDIEAASRHAMHIASRESLLNYSEKVVVALRYNVGFRSLGLHNLRRTNGEVISIGTVVQYFPMDVGGLKLESASALSGLSPYGILEIEERLLTRFAHGSPVLLERLEHIKAKKQRLIDEYQKEHPLEDG